MYDSKTKAWVENPQLTKLKKEREAARKLQEHKHNDWDTNYELYRNKVKTNRLTQRQAVNIPLMKETIKTLISKIDDAPNIDWKEKNGQEDKEIIYQEIWDTDYKDNKLELVDLIDKKNVLLYGVSTKKLNIDDTGVKISVLDPYDIVLDPLMSAGQIETARFVIHQNIYRTIEEVLNSDRYSKEAKDQLKIYAMSPPGITQGNENREEYERKVERMKSMGLSDSDLAMYGGGDRVINLCEHYTRIWNDKTKKYERRVITYADDSVILSDEKLIDLIGVDFWPFTFWCEDPESTDIYSDSVADLVRVPNQVLNVWFSQLIENRTLKNFQMHWFLPSQNYTPQTYTPGPGMMLPAPPGDDINKVIKPVEVSGLDDTFQAISALTQIVERGTGATAIEKGTAEKGTQTLGEVEILVGKAGERAVSMAKFYRMSWYETATKWNAIMQANGPKIRDLYKVSHTGKAYPKKVLKADWKGDYEPIVVSTSEQEQNELKTLQKFQYVLQQFPNNMALRKIAQKRQLESLDLSGEELKQISEEEDKNAQMMQMQAQMQSGQPQQPVVSPMQMPLNKPQLTQ